MIAYDVEGFRKTLADIRNDRPLLFGDFLIRNPDIRYWLQKEGQLDEQVRFATRPVYGTRRTNDDLFATRISSRRKTISRFC